jgi:hypothetical protein
MAATLEQYISSGQGIFTALQEGQLQVADATGASRLLLNSQGCNAEVENDFVPNPATMTMHEVTAVFCGALVAFREMKEPSREEIDCLGNAVILAWTDHKRQLAMEYAVNRIEASNAVFRGDILASNELMEVSVRAIDAELVYRRAYNGLAEKVTAITGSGE